jgi:signal transduction histidine kinase
LTALAELAAGAGHEINNPLAVISGHCQRLLGHEEDEETRATLETVVRQTKRIHEILRGLMQFARPAKPAPHPVRTADLVGSALADVRNLAAVKAVELREDVTASGTAVCDPHQLKTCLVNLLRNAVEAARPDGWVRVGAGSTGDRVRVVIEDSGPGPAPGQAAHLFDPFYSGKAAGRGRGLGLSVAWRLAAVNGATLRHDPTPDSPARFVLSIPAAAEAAARISA